MHVWHIALGTIARCMPPSTPQAATLWCILDVQVEQSPVPPPLKSPWADIVRQHARQNAGAAKVTSPRATADAAKTAVPQAQDRQPSRARDLPSYARPAPGPVSHPQPRSLEPSAKAPAREGPHAGTAPNAANGGRAPATMKPAQPEVPPAPSSAPSVPPVAVGPAAGAADTDGTSTGSTDDKGTPRQQEVRLSNCSRHPSRACCSLSTMLMPIQSRAEHPAKLPGS